MTQRESPLPSQNRSGMLRRTHAAEYPTAGIDWTDARDLSRVREAIAKRADFADGRSAKHPNIEMVQTHISTVFLTDKYVFKFKRPVDLGFLDFRTLRRRRIYCMEEVRLNRRLAPDVYLDLATLWRAQDGFRLDRGEPRDIGAIADVAVVMKRLPPESMLDHRVRGGTVTLGDIRKVADALARFHANLHPAQEQETYGGPETWHVNWDENFRQTRGAIGATISRAAYTRIQRAVGEFLARERDRFTKRVYGGRVRDGHGDLRAEHICLLPRVRIIDCIEFNARFRYGDVANDLAFLLMDLHALGRPDLARALYLRYVHQSGDREMAPLMAFYCCYRAYVRGKVTAMRLQDRHMAKALRRTLTARAKRFFALALEFARATAPPKLLLVSGLMGTGKSRLADEIGKRTGADVIASDKVRKELAAREAGGLSRKNTRRADFGAGIYTEAWNRRTYDEMLARAKAALLAGRSVVLDATFSRRADRERAFALAKAVGAGAHLAECRLPDAVALRRLRGRERGGRSVSDGRAALFPGQKAAFEPATEVPRGQRTTADTRQPAGRLAARVIQAAALPEAPSPFALPAE